MWIICCGFHLLKYYGQSDIVNYVVVNPLEIHTLKLNMMLCVSHIYWFYLLFLAKCPGPNISYILRTKTNLTIYTQKWGKVQNAEVGKHGSKPKMGTWKVISWKVLNLGWISKRILKSYCYFKIHLLKK
jgi:hypothetical protein